VEGKIQGERDASNTSPTYHPKDWSFQMASSDSTPQLSIQFANTCECGCGRECKRRFVSGHNPTRCKHGMAANGYVSPELRTWYDMRRRCYAVERADYKDYGGRGIKVCERWLSSFECFYEDMGSKPSPAHSIDRIDNDGDYCPENCRWATSKEQAINRSNNRLLTHNGITKTLKEWSDDAGISFSAFWLRLARGWTMEQALLYPCRKSGPKVLKGKKRKSSD
jgi:hypothetical protein